GREPAEESQFDDLALPLVWYCFDRAKSTSCWGQYGGPPGVFSGSTVFRRLFFLGNSQNRPDPNPLSSSTPAASTNFPRQSTKSGSISRRLLHSSTELIVSR